MATANASGAASQPTMGEGLTGLLATLDTLDLAPDADPEFLSNLRSMIVTKVRESQAANLTSQAETLTGSGPPPSAMGADMGGNLSTPPEPTPISGGAVMASIPGGPMPGAMGVGAPGPGRGLSPAPEMPDPDSLRRILNIG